MASTMALRKASSNSFISKLLNPAVVPSVCRCFTSDTQPANTVNVQRRSSSDRSVATSSPGSPPPSPAFLSDWIDPFSPTRTLSQVFNLMDQLMDPVYGTTRGVGGRTGTTGVGVFRGWDVKEDDKALYLKIDMPGVGKEDVKVWVEGDVLVIKGEGEGEGEEGKKFSSRIQLPPNLYKLDDIKGEMKNGVLKLVVPKVTEEERKDVHEVQVE